MICLYQLPSHIGQIKGFRRSSQSKWPPNHRKPLIEPKPMLSFGPTFQIPNHWSRHLQSLQWRWYSLKLNVKKTFDENVFFLSLLLLIIIAWKATPSSEFVLVHEPRNHPILMTRICYIKRKDTLTEPAQLAFVHWLNQSSGIGNWVGHRGRGLVSKTSSSTNCIQKSDATGKNLWKLSCKILMM